MRPSALMTLLFGAGLPGRGYDFLQQSPAEREAMLEQLAVKTATVASASPVLTVMEIDAEHTIYLITQPGHFAHPSILQRSLISAGDGRAVQSMGFTAAPPEHMAAWLGQFREQDESLRQAVTKYPGHA